MVSTSVRIRRLPVQATMYTPLKASLELALHGNDRIVLWLRDSCRYEKCNREGMIAYRMDLKSIFQRGAQILGTLLQPTLSLWNKEG